MLGSKFYNNKDTEKILNVVNLDMITRVCTYYQLTSDPLKRNKFISRYTIVYSKKRIIHRMPNNLSY